MKTKLLIRVCMVQLAVGGMLLIQSCGTIGGAITGGKRPTFIVNAPSDVVVKLNGEVQDITSELHASNVAGSRSVDYYTSAIKIPYKHPVTLEISSERLKKSGSVDLKPKGSGAIFVGNLLIFPVIGHIIDGVTKNNKTLRPKYIDVTSVLNNVAQKDWPSQSRLKANEKRKAR